MKSGYSLYSNESSSSLRNKWTYRKSTSVHHSRPNEVAAASVSTYFSFRTSTRPGCDSFSICVAKTSHSVYKHVALITRNEPNGYRD